MKSLFRTLFLVIFLTFSITGCSSEEITEITIYPMKSFSETIEKKVTFQDSEEIQTIVNAFKSAKKVPGVADMADPHFKVRFAGENEESYFLWLHENQGTIMNFNDTHTIYTLSEDSAKDLNKILKED